MSIMYHNREQIIYEILEHTKDCDYNRSQHFVEYKRYKIISDMLSFLQIGTLIILVIFCSIVMPETQFQHNSIKYIAPIILSLIATTAQLIDYFCNFSDLAQQHWLAAQAYARLYRQCQFFPSHYGTDCDEHIMRENAMNICNELFDLNLMSPNLSERSYKKVSYLIDKQYPIESITYQSKTKHLKKIARTIQREMTECEIEIVSFGSYMSVTRNSDIDIAIVVHSAVVDEGILFEKVMELEREFNRQKIKADLTLLTPSRLRLPSQIPFIKNIKNGDILYASDGVFVSIHDYTFDIETFKHQLAMYYELAEAAYLQSDVNNYINKAYYYVQSVMSFLLLKHDKTWSNETEKVDRWERILNQEPHLEPIQDAYLLAKKYKDNEASVGIDYPLSEQETKNLYSCITCVKSLLESII